MIVQINIVHTFFEVFQFDCLFLTSLRLSYRGADKLQRPNSNFCKPLRNNSEGCPPKQVSAAAKTSSSEEKWRPFNFFFQSGRAKYLSAPQNVDVRDVVPKSENNRLQIWEVQTYLSIYQNWKFEELYLHACIRSVLALRSEGTSVLRVN